MGAFLSILVAFLISLIYSSVTIVVNSRRISTNRTALDTVNFTLNTVTLSNIAVSPSVHVSPLHVLNSTSQNKKHVSVTDGLISESTGPSLMNVARRKQNRDVDYNKLSSKFMLDLYSNLRRGDNLSAASDQQPGTLDTSKTDTVRSFSPKGVSVSFTRAMAYEFRIPRLPKGERMLIAEFRVRRLRHSQPHGNKLKLYIKKSGKSIRKIILRIRPSLSNKKGFDIYDISSSISPWINGYHGNVTLRIVVRIRSSFTTMKEFKKKREHILDQLFGDAGREDALLIFYSENKEFFKKIYNSFTESETEETDIDSDNDNRQIRHDRERRKRESKRRKRKYSKARWAGSKGQKIEKYCRMYDFMVNFETIGWTSWVIQPKTFNAGICHGKCVAPIDSSMTPTNHAMIQSLMRRQRKSLAPMPCCAPTSLGPLSMLYYEYNEIVVRHHVEMVVSECGCR